MDMVYRYIKHPKATMKTGFKVFKKSKWDDSRTPPPPPPSGECPDVIGFLPSYLGRGGRCSFFFTMRCFADVFDKTIDLNVFGDV